MKLDDVDMTSESYTGYFIDEGMDEVTLHFKETDVIISSEDFNRLKEEIIGNEEGLSRVEVKVVDKTPKRETLLKELMKTTDKITDLTNRYDSTYYALMSDRECPSFKDDLEVKNKLRPMWKERNNLMNYREKLEAQLKYGELQ